MNMNTDNLKPKSPAGFTLSSGSADPPRCTDCEWMTKDSDDGTPLCKRPGLGRKNAVNGGMLYPPCDEQREDNDWLINFIFGKTCGEKAKYFQPNVRISDSLAETSQQHDKLP